MYGIVEKTQKININQLPIDNENTGFYYKLNSQTTRFIKFGKIKNGFGYRVYLLCPKCKNKFNNLYLSDSDILLCRFCMKLHYKSNRSNDPKENSIGKIKRYCRIHFKANDTQINLVIIHGISPSKPIRMKREKYKHHCRILHKLYYEYLIRLTK